MHYTSVVYHFTFLYIYFKICQQSINIFNISATENCQECVKQETQLTLIKEYKFTKSINNKINI